MNNSPRLALWLLTLRLRASDCDEIIGDLEEQFIRRVVDEGPSSARRWYWRQALALALSWGLRCAPTTPHAMTRGSVTSMDDLRYAVRRFLKQPGVTTAAIVTLSVAIGANVSAWSLVTAVLVRPLPVEAPERLMVVGRFSEKGKRIDDAHSYPLYPAVRESGIFQAVAAGGSWSQLVADKGLAESRLIFFASHNFFDALGVRLPKGRPFSPEDDQVGAPLAAILSDRFWNRAFDADPGVIGRTLTVSGKTATIIGVAPRGFRGASLVETPDLYLPLHTVADVGNAGINFFADVTRTDVSPTSWVHIFGRLRLGTMPLS